MINKIYKVLLNLLYLVATITFCEYMRINLGTVMYFIIYFIFLYLVKNINKDILNKNNKLLLIMFSCIFSFFIIFGYKLNINGSNYFGLYNENYVDNFNLIDIFGIILLTGYIYVILYNIIYFIFINSKKIKLKESKFNKKYFILIALLLFVLWIPYLLIYYPGFIFGDTTVSISQALKLSHLTNQHSVVYTYFIRLCIWIGKMFSSNINFGLAISTVIQMIYIAFGLSYLIVWLRSHGVNKIICIFFILLFGIVPFYTTHSIALWKDPIWSTSIMLWSLDLLDYVLTDGKILNKKYIIKTFILLLLIVLFRNNGFFVILFSLLVMLVAKLLKKITFNIKPLIILSFIGVFIYVGIAKPIYKKYNIEEHFADSVGVLLSQMSNVVVNNGNLSQEELDYMNKLLPLNKYKSTYRPCVVDLLKWDWYFNNEYLNTNKIEFFKNYFSIMKKNKLRYLQSWGLITYGYWAFNRWELNNDALNINNGNIQNKEELFGGRLSDLKKIFTIYDSMISLSILNWVIFFICLLIIMKKNYKYLIPLSPTLGIIFSLFIASPNAYWQRYELTIYYLIPVYILILIYSLKGAKNEIKKRS